jgi:hypothetical protein
VDGGIRVETIRGEALRRADWKAHIAGPSRRCLECLGQYEAGLVSAEREGYFADPRYIAGLPSAHPVRQNENVFAFSLSAAGFEVLQALMMIVAPLGIGSPGAQTYHFVPGSLDSEPSDGCNAGCPYPQLVAQGDSSSFIVTGRHARAEQARAERALASRLVPWRYLLADVLVTAARWLSSRTV